MENRRTINTGNLVVTRYDEKIFIKINEQRFKLSVVDSMDLIGALIKLVDRKNDEMNLQDCFDITISYFLKDFDVVSKMKTFKAAKTTHGLSKLVRSPTRVREIVMVRQTFCAMAKKNTNSSLKAIGSYIGGRDHSTAIHAIQAFSDLSETDAKFKRIKEDLSI